LTTLSLTFPFSNSGSGIFRDHQKHPAQRCPDLGIPVSHFVQFTPWIMLLPELFGQVLAGRGKLSEPLIELAGFSKQPIEIMSFYQDPSLGNKIPLQVSLRGLVEEFHTRPRWPEPFTKGIGLL
jgi:hypothetical protein